MKVINASLKSSFYGAVTTLKSLYYGRRGEPITYGEHKLRYVPGTRPVRLKYVNSPIETVRNDAKQINFFLEQIKPGESVLDIGGNVGQYAVLFASLVTESGEVISFEPDAFSRDVLRRNLTLNGFLDRVLVEDIALFDTTGTQPFFSKGNGDATASLIDSHLAEGLDSKAFRKELVRTERLDDYLASREFRCPDWIKLDTEGAEINILRGARETLKCGAKIACELHPYVWPGFKTTFEELLDILSECGRTIEYLDESHSIKDGPLYGAAIIL